MHNSSTDISEIAPCLRSLPLKSARFHYGSHSDSAGTWISQRFPARVFLFLVILIKLIAPGYEEHSSQETGKCMQSSSWV